MTPPTEHNNNNNERDKMSTVTKKPALFTIEQIEYYEILARVSIRRLFPMRHRADARDAIAGWIGTLRDAKRIRAYRNF